MSDKDGEIPQFNQKLIMMVQNQRADFWRWGVKTGIQFLSSLSMSTIIKVKAFF